MPRHGPFRRQPVFLQEPQGELPILRRAGIDLETESANEVANLWLKERGIATSDIVAADSVRALERLAVFPKPTVGQAITAQVLILLKEMGVPETSQPIGMEVRQL